MSAVGRSVDSQLNCVLCRYQKAAGVCCSACGSPPPVSPHPIHPCPPRCTKPTCLPCFLAQAYVARFQSVFPNKADKYAHKYQKFSVADVRLIIFHKLFTGEQDKGFKGHPDALLESVGR